MKKFILPLLIFVLAGCETMRTQPQQITESTLPVSKSHIQCEYKVEQDLGICVFNIEKEEDTTEIANSGNKQVADFCKAENFYFTKPDITDNGLQFFYFKCKEPQKPGLGL